MPSKKKPIEPFVIVLKAFVDTAQPQVEVRIESKNECTSLSLAALCMTELEEKGFTVHCYIMP